MKRTGLRRRAVWLLILAAVIACRVFPAAADGETDFMDTWGFCVTGLDLLREAAEKDERLQAPVTVAVIDTGCDTGHEIFRGRISEDSRSYYGKEDDISNPDGHGTSVASIIAAATPANVKLLILKVGENKQYASDEQFEEAIEYALEKGADVINFCISVPDNKPLPQDYRPWHEGIRRCREAGVPFVCGAGNDSTDASRAYPAADRNAIAVSAVTIHGKLSDISNYGESVRFSAPGTWIRVARSGTKDEYMYSGGTSLAAPHVTAAIAYIKMLHPNWNWEQTVESLRSCAVKPKAAGGEKAPAEMPEISRLLLEQAPSVSLRMIPELTWLTATGGNADEGPENLFDGDPDTKWCLHFSGTAFAEWKTEQPVAPSAILLTTANDNLQYPGRNPEKMILQGRNGPEEEWKTLWEQEPGQQLPDRNYAGCVFRFPEPEEAYSCFRLMINATGGSDVLQMSMIELVGCRADGG